MDQTCGMTLNTHLKGVTLNAYENGSSEHLLKLWLWMPMQMMVLNAYENSGSEHLYK